MSDLIMLIPFLKITVKKILSNHFLISEYLVICILTFIALPYAVADSQNIEALSVVEKDITDVFVRADGSDDETIERQVLIRSQLAVDTSSQVDIPYLNNFQTIKVIEAYTITPEGKKIFVGKDAIRTVDGDSSDGKSQFSDVKHRIIIFPNVSPGSKTYYKAVISTSKPLFPGHYFVRYWFGPGTQWQNSEINLSHDPKIPLQVDARGVNGGKIAMGPNGEVRYRFSYQSNGIQLSEPNQIADSDFAPHVYISSFKDQLDMARAYELRAKDKYQVTPEVQKLADQITSGISDPKEQAKALYFWVSKEIRYVAIFLGAGGVVPHSANTIIKNRYGDCKDKTTLLIALLNAKGIAASTAEINLGNSYELPKLAVLGPFNHVITYIPAWDIYVDPTAERAPFGVLPLNEMDKPTVLTGLGKIGRTQKPLADENTVSTNVELIIANDGGIKGQSHTVYSGAEDISARYAYEGADSTYGKHFVRDNLINARLSGTGIYKLSSADDLSIPYSVDTEFDVDPVTNFPGLGAISPPMGLAPAELSKLAYNKPPQRVTKPVVCRSRSVFETLVIRFPDDVKIFMIPEGVLYRQAGIEFSSSYSRHGNEIKIKRKMKVQHPSMICDVQDIENWKRFISILQRDLRGQIFYE
ncbi:DUF3857 domain-containing protein [Polynucleobacter paneuropaeus]|nr:DUF3857 domain-containing protein [Polynucleobacter paneuropaeus]